MRIKKFNIENVGSFLKFNWDDSLGDKELVNGLNIFYGDNGNGKSTVVRIFKKLNGDSTIVLDKNWDIGEDKGQNFNFEDRESIEYNFDSEIKDNFIIFDKNYIKDNIGDVVYGDISTESNKNRGTNLVVLGEFVEKEKIVNRYEVVIRQLEEKNILMKEGLEEQKIKLNNYLLGDKTISFYKENLEEIKLEKNLKSVLSELEKEKKEIGIKEKNIEKLKGLEELDVLSEIDFDQKGYEEVFLDTFESVDFIYGEGAKVESLLNIIRDNKLDKCILCDNKITDDNGDYIERLKVLFTHFLSDKEKEISDKLKELNEIILYLETDFSQFNIRNKLIFKNFQECSGDTKFVYNNLKINSSEEEKELLVILKEKIREKNSVKSKELKMDLQDFCLLVDRINKKIKSFNIEIHKINKEIARLKLVNIVDLDKKETEIKNNLIEVRNKYFIQTNIVVIENYFREIEIFNENIKKIKELEKGKEIFKDVMNISFKEFASKYGEEIKNQLKFFNSSIDINIEINPTSYTSYNRGAARCGFKYEYKGKIIGDMLSEGEKRAIALSFFFAEISIKINEKSKLEEELGKTIDKVKKEFNLEEKKKLIEEIKNLQKQKSKLKEYFDRILILDDPAVDFDNGHKKQIASSIVREFNSFSQSFVFSHDSLFISYLSNSIGNSGNKKEFWIYKTKGVSNITEFDIDIFNKYKTSLEEFQELSSPPEIQHLYINTYKLRFCLEKFIKDDLLGFNNSSIDGLINGNLTDIKRIKKISENYIDEIKEVYNFCNNNGSHFLEVTEGYNALKKNIETFLKIYFECNS